MTPNADPLAAAIVPVAHEVLGEPNKALSSRTEERFGSRGSLAVDLRKLTWFDHEQKEGGGTLDFLKKYKGLSNGEALDFLRERGLIEARRDENAANYNRNYSDPMQDRDPPRPKREIRATYDYVDEAGALIFQVCRFDRNSSPPFLQRRPDPGAPDGWTWSTKGVRQVPYRLPDLVEAVALGRTVFIAEGEKDVDNLVRLGLPATCNAGGSGKWPEGLTEHFAGADVVILPDNDEAGRKHRDLVGRSLKGVAKAVRVLDLALDWPDMPAKADVSDWIERGGTAERLHAIVESHARPWTPGPPETKFGARLWTDLDRPGPEHEWLIEDLLSAGDRSIVAGPSRSGKSFLALDAAMAVARGAKFFGYDVQPGLVVYQAGEGARGILKRLRAYRQHHGLQTADDLPFVLLSSPVDLYHPEGSTKNLIDEIKGWAAFRPEPLRLVVIDTLSTATAGADENSGKDMSTVLANIARIADETGAHVLLVHHLNAGGTKLRGHTSILANVDQVIEVMNVDGIRTATLTKQKDGEDGISFRFKLKSVAIGMSYRRDGSEKPVTSCVVEPATLTEERRASGAAFKPTPNDTLFLQALMNAQAVHGTVPPPALHLPRAIKSVVHYDQVKIAFKELNPDDGDEPDKYRERLKKNISRARERLQDWRIIGVVNPYVWWTGRPVRGFGTEAPALPDDPPPSSLDVPADVPAGEPEPGGFDIF